MNWFQAFLPVYGLAADMALVVLLSRCGFSLLKSVYAAFVCGLGLVLAASWFSGAAFPQLLADSLCFAALGYGFFHFLNMGETARRIRLLLELEAGGQLAEAEILSRYSAKDIVDVRLGRLLRNGQIKELDGRYVIGGSAVLFMAMALVALKKILLGKTNVEISGA